MKKSILSLLFSLSAVCVFAQANDPVVMVINGKDVTRSEFEYSYRKNNSEGVIDKKTVKEYVDLFVNYKLKVEAAYAANLDTLTSFKNEFAEYRNQLVLPTMITDDDIEREAQNIYNSTAERIGPDGLIKCSHILLTVSSDATQSEKDAVKARIDSLYSAIKNGADFTKLAIRVSQDPGSARNGGKMDQWVQRGAFVQPFDNVAFSLQKGEVSEPVETSFGLHIIKMDDRKQFDPYDSLRTDILNYIEARKLRDQIAKDAVEARAKEQGVDLNVLTAEQAKALSAKDSDMKYLIMEYHDGLLLYEISSQEVWNKAGSDEAALAAYFKKNQSKYVWDAPHFKGIAYHTKTKSDLKAVKKTVKKLDFSQWGDKLKEVFNSDSTIRVRAEKGVFKIGDNSLVDSLAFKIYDKPAKKIKGYDYRDICGKVIKKPENYEDVKAQVTADYQEFLEKEWVASLRRKYSVAINEDEIAKIKD